MGCEPPRIFLEPGDSGLGRRASGAGQLTRHFGIRNDTARLDDDAVTGPTAASSARSTRLTMTKSAPSPDAQTKYGSNRSTPETGNRQAEPARSSAPPGLQRPGDLLDVVPLRVGERQRHVQSPPRLGTWVRAAVGSNQDIESPTRPPQKAPPSFHAALLSGNRSINNKLAVPYKRRIRPSAGTDGPDGVTLSGYSRSTGERSCIRVLMSRIQEVAEGRQRGRSRRTAVVLSLLIRTPRSS
jgi:hypothetical protein